MLYEYICRNGATQRRRSTPLYSRVTLAVDVSKKKRKKLCEARIEGRSQWVNDASSLLRLFVRHHSVKCTEN